MRADLSELADTYLRLHSEHSEGDLWAHEEVDRIIRENRDLDRAWEITLLLLRKATDEQLGYVAAGPLEDIIDIYGGEALDRIERSCDDDPRLQFALSGVWLLPDNPVLSRWRALMAKYGFALDKRRPLSYHSDCW